MLQAMLQHCLKQWLKHVEGCRVRAVRTTYGASMSRSCAAAVPGGGQRSNS